MFSTKNVKSSRRTSPYLSYGSKQELKITDILIQKFANNRALRVAFRMESRPVEDDKFVPVDGAEGQVGTVIARSYIAKDSDQTDFVKNVVLSIAIAAGVRNELDKVEADNFEEYIEKIKPILCGKFCRWFIAAKEYMSADGKNRVKYNLRLPRFGFVESLESQSKMAEFDKENKYHYAPLATENAPATYTKQEVKQEAKPVESFSAPEQDEDDDDDKEGLPF